MGATYFEVRVRAESADSAFKQAQEQAFYDHGHSGYTGTIAEKDGYIMMAVNGTETVEQAMERAGVSGSAPLTDAQMAEVQRQMQLQLAQQLDDAAAGLGGMAADEQVLRLESDADLVKVVTVHKSKGLEYPLVLLPFAVWEWRQADTPAWSAQAGWLVLAAALVPGIGAYWAYGFCQKVLGASRVAASLYMGPLYGGLTAWLVLGESLGWRHVMGALLILPGIYLASRK